MSKQIRDNLYGFFTVYDDEIPILEHPFFQRLRRIKQNGLLEYVYPAAKHDRFIHSLGVNHLVKMAFIQLRETYSDNKEKNDFLTRILKLFGLQHYSTILGTFLSHIPVKNPLVQIMKRLEHGLLKTPKLKI